MNKFLEWLRSLFRPKPQPRPGPSPGANSAWWFENSVGMPARPQAPCIFTFPSHDGVHALVTDRNTFVPQLGKTIRIRFKIENAGNLVAYDRGAVLRDERGIPVPAYASLIIHRQGDNMSAEGAYEYYRFYSDSFIELKDGEHSWDVPVSADAWHSIYNRKNEGAFKACLQFMRVFGIVFGNPPHGATAHGVGGAGAKFELLGIELV